jgi:hypothetical protein
MIIVLLLILATAASPAQRQVQAGAKNQIPISSSNEKPPVILPAPLK